MASELSKLLLAAASVTAPTDGARAGGDSFAPAREPGQGTGEGSAESAPGAGPEVQAEPGTARAAVVRAVIPVFNRRADLARLLDDIRRLRLPQTPAVDLRVLVVDNASDEPVADLASLGSVPIGVLRLEENTGGSGGFNAGLSWWIHNEPIDAPAVVPVGAEQNLEPVPARRHDKFFWLLDSDVRLHPDALAELISAAGEYPESVVLGSALAHVGQATDELADPTQCAIERAEVYELGGRVSRRTGEYVQPQPPRLGKGGGRSTPVPVEYVAACSMLVRQWAAEHAGLMADVFINGDDVEWCVRLARVSGGAVLAVPRSIAFHPHSNRMRTWDRLYAARNAFMVGEAVGLGWRARLARAVREVGRALCQTMIGRDDLASLHLSGLWLAALGPRGGRADADLLRFERPRPIEDLPRLLAEAQRDEVGDEAPQPMDVRVERDLGLSSAAHNLLLEQLASNGMRVIESGSSTRREELVEAVRRLFLGPPAPVAIVSARGWPSGWLAGRSMYAVSPLGWTHAELSRPAVALRAMWVMFLGAALAATLALRGPARGRKDRVERVRAPARPTHRPTISAVVLSYNRPEALHSTHKAMLAQLDMDGGDELIIVDNASSAPTQAVLEAIEAQRRTGVQVHRLPRNIGVGGFNRGVRYAAGELVLVLDDDAIPSDGVLERAREFLAQRQDVPAVALVPVHPRTGRSEWPMATNLGRATDQWPFMGCANLVRHTAWRRCGGYEKGFFLYRNDTDLALKLNALRVGPHRTPGSGVRMDPAWTVWHDSQAASSKSPRWFETGTRNWVWMCTRHGRGLTRWVGIGMGLVWTLRAAGLSPTMIGRTMMGLAAGLRRHPPLPSGIVADGSALQLLLGTRLRTVFPRLRRLRPEAEPVPPIASGQWAQVPGREGA